MNDVVNIDGSSHAYESNPDNDISEILTKLIEKNNAGEMGGILVAYIDTKRSLGGKAYCLADGGDAAQLIGAFEYSKLSFMQETSTPGSEEESLTPNQ